MANGILCALVIVLAAFAAPVAALAGDKPPQAFMQVSFEQPDGGAFAQEMVVMHVRSFFKSRATIEHLEQPALDELGWTQLGQDDWAPTKVNNETFFGFERRLAVFAPEARRYTIAPFIHHVTLIDPEGVRWKLDVKSDPVTLTIRKWTQPHDGPLDEDTWWLPARSVSVKDQWNGDPSDLAPGDTIRRTIELTAVGVQAEQLPPAIDTTTPGLVIFPGPVARRTEVVDDLPVGHAIYSFDVRPHTGDAVILPEVLVPWFDTAARMMRQVAVPGASVGRGLALGRIGSPDDTGEPGGVSAKLVWSLAAGALAFFVGACVLLLPGRADREPVPQRLARLFRELRRTGAVRIAALRDDPKALRTALYRLARQDGRVGALWLASPAASAALAGLDRPLFAGMPRQDIAGKTTIGNLRRAAETILDARRRCLRGAAKD